ncbi:organomercurial lyase [Geodermatophilus arenarius]|uniref:Organomercurial lyase n=1 Tax=Geodermatophilus arenarius TaxID=1137990 RepID=A0ABV9LL65_9ACTN
MDLEDVRLAVYTGFALEGRPPAPDELAHRFDVSPQRIRDALEQLAAARHLVLDQAGSIVMAHPFSAIPLGFSVMGSSTLWWGGCAWDSFAMPHLLHREPALLVATTCPACAAPHAWNVTRTAPPEGDQVAHFLVPAARIWDDVVRTCGHQRIFCGETCVDAWLDRTGNDRGYVMDLTTLWRLASDWYTGRFDRGYTRREPARAADYMRSVGLSGPFWGL